VDVSRKSPYRVRQSVALLILASMPVFARIELSDLPKKLLYGDKATKLDAVNAFNKLSSDDQSKLLPDFMVAMRDDDPQVRKIAGRILKAMGVTTDSPNAAALKDQSQDASKTTTQEKWSAEKKMAQENEADKWSDLKQMHQGESSNYDGMKKEVELEKNGQLTLDASQLLEDIKQVPQPQK